MAYQITLTDGSNLTTVGEEQTNVESTSLTLIGQRYVGYGEFINENFISLLENFSNTTAPRFPLQGQLWWDKSIKVLKVYDGAVWKTTKGSTSSASEPSTPATGEFWWNSTTRQLSAWNGSAWTVIGPIASQSVSTSGESGVFVDSVLDNLNSPHIVMRFMLNGTLVGVANKDAEFTTAQIPGIAVVKQGFNLTSGKFRGTADDADTVGSLLPTQLVRNDQAGTINGALTVNDDAGVSIGTGVTKSLLLRTDGNEVRLISNINDRPLKLQTTTGGNNQDVLSFNATTRLGTVAGDPTASLGIATKQYVDLKANIASPTFTGTPTAPTPTAGSAGTQIATKDYVIGERAAIATLTNKTLTAPVLSNPSFSGTTASMGSVTTIDINGGSIDGTVIGANVRADGSFLYGNFEGVSITGNSALSYPSFTAGLSVNNSGSTTSAIQIGSSPAAGSSSLINDNGDFVLRTAAERLRVTRSSGLVYINRTTDDGTSSRLQVNGSISSSNTVRGASLVSTGTASITSDLTASSGLYMPSTANGIYLDSSAQKGLTWSGTDGSLVLRSGYSYVTSADRYTVTGDGAARIVMDSDTLAGAVRISVAPTGTAGGVVSWTNTLTIDTTASSVGNSGLKYNNNQVWHSANDGAGSGLDADLLDGQQGSYYLDLVNTTGTLTVSKGGTGASSFTNGSILQGNGTGSIMSATAANLGAAMALGGNRATWETNGVIGATVGMLAWKNYGNNHIIFDASAGTAPDGTSISNANSSNGWTGTFPTLMGWNGSQTYGVRVDSARVADTTLDAIGNGQTWVTYNTTDRAAGVQYTNNTGRTITVLVSYGGLNYTSTFHMYYPNGVLAFSSIFGHAGSVTGVHGAISLPVPPGYRYLLSVANGRVWAELR